MCDTFRYLYYFSHASISVSPPTNALYVRSEPEMWNNDFGTPQIVSPATPPPPNPPHHQCKSVPFSYYHLYWYQLNTSLVVNTNPPTTT